MAGPYTYTFTGTGNWSTVARWGGGQGSDYPGQIHAITGAANNGSGLIRLTIASTATFATGDTINVRAVGGTTEANAQWVVTVVDGTHLDLQSSTFTNAYTSGGTLARNDTVIINGTATGDVDADFGANPTGDTPALTINSGGSAAQTSRRLTLNVGVRLRPRGPVHDLQPTAIGITFGSGSGIEIDPSYATISTAWSVRCASAYDGGQSVGGTTPSLRGWRFNGSLGSKCFVKTTSNGGTKNAYNYNGSFGGENCWQGSYVDFENLGDATRQFWRPALDNRGLTNSLANYTITNCGELFANFTHGAASLTLTDGNESGSLCNGTTTFPLNVASTSDQTTGTRSQTRASWSKILKYNNCHGWVSTACYFHDGWVGAGTKLWGLTSDCFIRQTYDSLFMSGSISGCFSFYDMGTGEANGGAGNPHGWAFNPSVTAGSTMVCSGNILYYTGSSSAGNAILSGQPTTGHTLRIAGNIIMPNGGNLSTGAITIYNTAAAGYSVEIYKNTICVAGQHGIEIGHLYGGGGLTVESPNRYTIVQDNLFFGTGSGAAQGYKAFDTDGVGANNIIPPAIIRHNFGYLTYPTFVGGGANYAGQANGWAAKFTGAVPDAVGGLDGVNPGFVAPTRDLASWAVTQGSVAATKAGREADGCALIKAAPGYVASSFMPYLFAAFGPTHASYRYGDYAGTGVIGAAAWVATSTGGFRLVGSGPLDSPLVSAGLAY